MKNKIKDTSILEDYHCKDCGEYVIHQCNNTQLANFEFDDWILYCANMECENHKGEGYFQEMLDWVERD
jgi:hypothetical protein